MKRLLFFICASFLFLSCNDGDLSVTTFNFTNQTVSKCTNNNFIYKVEGNEAMILDIPQNNFSNELVLDENNNIVPKIYTLTSSDILVYRHYNQSINQAILCSSFVDSEISVTDEWKALPGATIQISTIANYDSNNGGILGITGYTHSITLKDVVFTKGDSQMVFEQYNFGNYTTINPIKFNFSTNLLKCDNKNLLYKLNLNESLVADFNSNLFVNELTNDVPRTAIIGADNALVYSLFSQNITSAYYCASIPQSTPTVVNQWLAQAGVAGESGVIEVFTTELRDQVTNELTGYLHQVILKNILFQNNNSSFFLSEYELGSFAVGL